MSARRNSGGSGFREATPMLKIDLADAQEQLDKRIAEGRVISGLPAYDAPALKSVEARYKTWNEYNITLLETMFTTNRIALEYKQRQRLPAE